MNSFHPIDRPIRASSSSNMPKWGSDVIVDIIRALDIEYVAVLPGATTRGLHDSIVNYAMNSRPELILCTHEMITASLARGYARVTGQPMATLIHNLVGLLNTSMSIFDAWYDRVPMLVIGGAGPLDSSKRRPWIDWLHTSNDQGATVRNFTKWDDQPASLAAAVESLLRAYRISNTEPRGPVYVSLDVEIQEQEISDHGLTANVKRYAPARPLAPDLNAIEEVAALLVESELPMVFADRVGRSAPAVSALVELAELLALPVIDMGGRMNFPSPHPLEFTGMSRDILRDADLVLALDALDLFGAMRTPANPVTRRSEPITRQEQLVVSISIDEFLHRGWSTEYQGLPAVDLPILADTSIAISLLLEECRRLTNQGAKSRVKRRSKRLSDMQTRMRARQAEYVKQQCSGDLITEAMLLKDLWQVIMNEDFVITSGQLRRMAPGVVQLTRPDQYLSGSAGAVVGASPGVALGPALALKTTGKLPVAILGDGGLLMSIQVLWTAAHYLIPSLWIVNNNRSYFNDEKHQFHIAEFRARPVENAGIGQRLENPEVDFSLIAKSFGVSGIGPIRAASELRPALERALAATKRGEFVVVDVWTENRDRG